MQMGRVFFILCLMNQLDPDFDASEVIREVDAALKSVLLNYAKLLPPSLITLGKIALGAPGKVMYWSALVDRGEDAPLPRWPLMVILSYQASLAAEERAGWRAAMPAVVAVEIAVAAADLIDEAADDDPSPIIEQYGVGQALNTANLMLVMAQQVLLWEARAGNSQALDALGALQEMLVEAAVGQHLDMAYETMAPQEVSPDMSGEMTEKKAGALIGGSLKMGALMAGADGEVVGLLEQIGRHLGSIAQISNDLQDVLPRDAVVLDDTGREIEVNSNPKTDLRRRKRTLPIVYALREEAAEPNALQVAFSKPPDEHEDEDALRQVVVDAGGTRFAYLVTELYQNNLAEALDALEAIRPGARQVLAALL
jgi:geranylgeranyl diphosphate synthase type I